MRLLLLMLLLEGCLRRQGLRMWVKVLVRVVVLKTLLMLHIAAPVMDSLPLLVVMVPSTATVTPASAAIPVMAIPTPSSSSRAVSGLPLPTLALIELLRQVHDIVPIVPREAWHAHTVMDCDGALVRFGALQKHRLVLSLLWKGQGPAMDPVEHNILEVTHIGARR